VGSSTGMTWFKSPSAAAWHGEGGARLSDAFKMLSCAWEGGLLGAACSSRQSTGDQSSRRTPSLRKYPASPQSSSEFKHRRAELSRPRPDVASGPRQAQRTQL